MNEKISDQKIVRHYLDRLESAILETKNKYGKLINLIAYNILCSKDDADECENDTYLNVWNSIPPNEPENLKAYCLRISRKFVSGGGKITTKSVVIIKIAMFFCIYE